MWRMFRWLDRHEPGFYKFTVMIAALAAVAGAALLLFRAHPAAGIVFGFGSVFALMKASMTYRFEKKPQEPPQSGLPISEASDREIRRRVRRHVNTEFWRRQILSARHEKGKRGDLARSIIKRWEEEGMPEGKPVEPEAGKGDA